ncbi:hypothetical protein [Cucumibacter marinus]|uniref:hypothetical protein n=1 Tax=Cucumibacter marinus TaxID=1121252 RepID=UPI00041F6CFF|nr:hypothetical protein [Cucumibacter marinus]
MFRQIAPLSLLALVLVAGCARFDSGVATSRLSSVGPQPQPISSEPATQPQTTQTQPTAAPRLADSSGLDFLDPTVAGKLSAADRSEAASAQFYALQFGRPGAPRKWQGTGGASGEVTVGPYVRVNALDCRDFTHSVTLSGQDYKKSGTACREANQNWQVVASR